MADENTQQESPEVELNKQTGKLTWVEIERHFARGVVITVKPSLDLVEVAKQMVEDNVEQMQAWLTSGEVVKTSIEEAKSWAEDEDITFWAVVAAPWLLIQEDISHKDETLH